MGFGSSFLNAVLSPTSSDRYTSQVADHGPEAATAIEGLCRLKRDDNVRLPPRREGFLFSRRRCFICAAENGHAGIAGGKDRVKAPSPRPTPGRPVRS